MAQIQGQKPRIQEIILARWGDQGKGEEKWDKSKNHSFVAFGRILVSQDLDFACKALPLVGVRRLRGQFQERGEKGLGLSSR